MKISLKIKITSKLKITTKNEDNHKKLIWAPRMKTTSKSKNEGDLKKKGGPQKGG